MESATERVRCAQYDTFMCRDKLPLFVEKVVKFCSTIKGQSTKAFPTEITLYLGSVGARKWESNSGHKIREVVEHLNKGHTWKENASKHARYL